MASGVYNEGAYQLRNGGSVDFAADTIKVALVSSAYSFDKDHASMTTPAASEISVTGYASGFAGAGRKTLASKTTTKDTTNDRIVYDAADPSAWTLATGDTVNGVIIQKKGSASDATAIPLWFLDVTDFPTNGGTFTLTFSTEGIDYIQN